LKNGAQAVNQSYQGVTSAGVPCCRFIHHASDISTGRQDITTFCLFAFHFALYLINTFFSPTQLLVIGDSSVMLVM
jgi:hypothetical protein